MFFNESREMHSSAVQATNNGYTPDMDGMRRIISESTEEWYNLREKMMRCEHTSIIKEDTLLLEAGVKGFFAGIAKWFKDMLARVKEYFNKFLAWLDGKIKSDVEFVRKYEGKVTVPKGFKYKGRKWKAGPEIADEIAANIKTAIGGLESKSLDELKTIEKEGFTEYIVKKITGNDDAKKFRTEVFKMMMDGDTDEAVEIGESYIKVQDMFDVIKAANASKKGVELVKAIIEAQLNNSITMYERLAKQGADESKDMKGDEKASYDSEIEKYTKLASFARAAITQANIAFGYVVDGIKARNAEYRAVIAKMSTTKGEDEKKSESFYFGEGNILDQF